MSFVFSEVWNATFEGEPSDTENINLGSGRIRSLKFDIRQRMQIDHQWAGNAFDGKHLRVTLPDGFAGSPDAGDGVVYAANVGGNTELWYRDSAGHFLQLTSNGSVNTPASFPVGTRISFGNAAPPAGWLQVVGGAGDRVIRLVDDSSGGTLGGDWVISGITVSTSTVTGTTTSTSTTTTTSTSTSTSVNATGSISVDPHTLTLAEIPSITLASDYPTFAGTSNSSGSNPSSLATGTTTHATSSVGGGGSHSHNVTSTLAFPASSVSSSSSDSSSTSFSASTSSSTSTAFHNGAWRPAYLNFCLGQKN
jgi:hypothetical protein